MSADLSVVSAAISASTEGFEEATALARSEDLVFLVLGEQSGIFRRGTVGEGTDATDLTLPGVQSALAQAIYNTGTPVVVLRSRYLADKNSSKT